MIKPVNIYISLFIILTLAQLVFTLAWYVFTTKLDHVIIVGWIIYSAAMLIGYISYEAEKYRTTKKQLLDNLP